MSRDSGPYMVDKVVASGTISDSFVLHHQDKTRQHPGPNRRFGWGG